MSYRYLEDPAIAAVSFEALGETREELFKACALAVLNVMIKDTDSIENKHRSVIEAKEEDLDTLLVDFLEEIIYYKDVYQLLLKPDFIQIEWEGEDQRYVLFAHMEGETIDPRKYPSSARIKAGSCRCLKFSQGQGGWNATLNFDILREST